MIESCDHSNCTYIRVQIPATMIFPSGRCQWNDKYRNMPVFVVSLGIYVCISGKYRKIKKCLHKLIDYTALLQLNAAEIFCMDNSV